MARPKNNFEPPAAPIDLNLADDTEVVCLMMAIESAIESLTDRLTDKTDSLGQKAFFALSIRTLQGILEAITSVEEPEEEAR